MRLSRKVLLLVSVPVVFELGMVGVLLNLLGQAKDDLRKSDHSREIVALLNTALTANTERMQILYLAKISGFQKLNDKVHHLAEKSAHAIQTAERLAAQDKEESALFQKISEMTRSLTEQVQVIDDLYSKGEKTRAAAQWIDMQNHIDGIMVMTDEFFSRQQLVQGQTQQAFENKERAITIALYISIAMSILTAFGLALFFNRSTSDRLNIIMQNTSRIAAGQKPEGRLSGDDELSRIDRLYNQMYQDLTGLREKERALLDNAAELICSIDNNLRISDINLSAEKILGLAPADLIGHRVLDLILAEDQSRIGAALDRAFESNAETRLSARLKGPAGSTVESEWVITASAGHDSIYCVILDVTQRKLIEQMRRDFVAMVSHDLRTPLNSIQMTLSLTQEEAESRHSLSQESLEGLTMAQNSANRLLALVNNLLDLEKLESGTFDLVARVRPVWRPLQEAVKSVEILAQQKKIALKLDAEQDLEAYFDDERIIQVVINLVSNAIKFSPKQSTITVFADYVGDYVRVEIRDQGRGIPPEMQSQIFERFKQVSAQDQRQSKGTGLGLAICKAIVERHQGKIGVQSTAEQGSTFWFTLPTTIELYTRLEKEAKNQNIG